MFKLDPFQEKAISYIQKDENVLVTAKTGSGKTLIGEYQIQRSLQKGKRVFYTTPIKSLSNQKFYDLKKLYPNRVGIMTGDIKFCPHADIVIMTTEILRNLLFKRGTSTETIGITADLSLNNLDAVVFDEVHYINDSDRGHVWEECLVLLPKDVNLVLLSATLDTPDPFCNWLTQLKQKPCHLVSTEYRVVPLVHKTEDGNIIMDSKDNFNMETYKSYVRKYYNQQSELRKHTERVQNREVGQVIERETRVGSFVDRMNHMIINIGKPALFFVFSRKQCEEFASKVIIDLLDSSETADVRHIVKFHLRNHKELETIQGYHTLFGLLVRGIAFHHSGMLPILKEIVEILFEKGFIKVLFATETFAVGINMPTKTVVFTSYRKFSDDMEHPRMLNTSEYIQMAGRAGRRGKDDIGIVMYLPIREPEEPENVKVMMTGKKATVESQMKFDYSYILATMGSKKSIEQQTYWYTQQQQELQCIETEIETLETSKPKIEQKEYNDCKTRYFIEQSIGRSVNAERKRLQTELNKWNDSHMGPKWTNAWKKYKDISEIQTRIHVLKEKVSCMLYENVEAEKRIQFLIQHGYISNGELTKKGILANEIHEGHPILMTELYHRELLKDKDSNTIVEMLSCFLEEPNHEEIIEMPSVLREIELFCKEHSWKITPYWIDVVRDWIRGNDFVCETYGIEHGNFVRAMLKLANIVREWISIATIAQDTEMIEKMNGMDQKIVRGFVIPDSLYLRI